MLSFQPNAGPDFGKTWRNPMRDSVLFALVLSLGAMGCNSMQGLRKDLVAAGASVCLRKPFDLEILTAMVGATLPLAHRL